MEKGKDDGDTVKLSEPHRQQGWSQYVKVAIRVFIECSLHHQIGGHVGLAHAFDGFQPLGHARHVNGRSLSVVARHEARHVPKVQLGLQVLLG